MRQLSARDLWHQTWSPNLLQTWKKCSTLGSRKYFQVWKIFLKDVKIYFCSKCILFENFKFLKMFRRKSTKIATKISQNLIWWSQNHNNFAHICRLVNQIYVFLNSSNRLSQRIKEDKISHLVWQNFTRNMNYQIFILKLEFFKY